MPIIILVVTIVLVVWLVMRQWLKTASEEDKKYLRRLTLWTVAVAGLFILIVTGRFFHAIGWAFMVILVLLVAGTLSKRKRSKYLRLSNHRKDSAKNKSDPVNGPMSIKKAYEILDVDEGASKKEIQAAYIHLIKIHHPDNGGSEEMSAMLNQAYDLLMDPNRDRDASDDE